MKILKMLAAQITKEYIDIVYHKIDFAPFSKLNPIVFETAVRGFYNLKASGSLSHDAHLLTVCDYSLSSNLKRLWVIDLAKFKVLLHAYVAHGQGTGDEYATAFSNKENSHQSSLGFYITGKTYIGEHGQSLYLHGMDKGYNCAAYQRSIVLHAAAYVSEAFINQHHRLGRSWGCPAVAEDIAPLIIDLIKEGTCLFAYYPDNTYLTSSRWLNKKSNQIQNEMEEKRFQLALPQQFDEIELPQLVSIQ